MPGFDMPLGLDNEMLEAAILQRVLSANRSLSHLVSRSTPKDYLHTHLTIFTEELTKYEVPG